MKKVKRIIAKIIVGQNVATIDGNLIDVNFEDLDRSNSSDLLNFGIYANRGSLSFVDKEGLAQKIISQYSSELNSVKVELYLTENSNEKLLKTLLVNDIDINEDTNIVTLELISKIIKWQNINVPIMYLFAPEGAYDTLSTIPVNELIESINNALAKQKEDVEILISPDSTWFFSSCKIHCIYLERDTLWNDITKICELCGARVYEDEYGRAYISSEFDNSYSAAGITPIIINPKNILQISNHSPIYKNRINKDFSARFKTRERKLNEYIDDGHTCVVYEGGNLFIEDNPQNTDTVASIYYGSELPSHDLYEYVQIYSGFSCPHKLFSISEGANNWKVSSIYYINNTEAKRLSTPQNYV